MKIQTTDRILMDVEVKLELADGEEVPKQIDEATKPSASNNSTPQEERVHACSVCDKCT